jgi:hypothetical protein
MRALGKSVRHPGNAGFLLLDVRPRRDRSPRLGKCAGRHLRRCVSVDLFLQLHHNLRRVMPDHKGEDASHDYRRQLPQKPEQQEQQEQENYNDCEQHHRIFSMSGSESQESQPLSSNFTRTSAPWAIASTRPWWRPSRRAVASSAGDRRRRCEDARLPKRWARPFIAARRSANFSVRPICRACRRPGRVANAEINEVQPFSLGACLGVLALTPKSVQPQV